MREHKFYEILDSVLMESGWQLTILRMANKMLILGTYQDIFDRVNGQLVGKVNWRACVNSPVGLGQS